MTARFGNRPDISVRMLVSGSNYVDARANGSLPHLMYHNQSIVIVTDFQMSRGSRDCGG